MFEHIRRARRADADMRRSAQACTDAAARMLAQARKQDRERAPKPTR